MYVYIYEKYKFDPPFLSLQAEIFFIGESKICPLTEFSGAGDKIDFDGNTRLLECEDKEYAYVSGLEIFNFRPDDKTLLYISRML